MQHVKFMLARGAGDYPEKLSADDRRKVSDIPYLFDHVDMVIGKRDRPLGSHGLHLRRYFGVRMTHAIDALTDQEFYVGPSNAIEIRVRIPDIMMSQLEKQNCGNIEKRLELYAATELRKLGVPTLYKVRDFDIDNWRQPTYKIPAIK